MTSVVHFEILSDDPEKTSAFYREALGWEVKCWPGGEYWLATTRPEGEPGINGGFTGRQPGLSQPVINTVQVDSLEDTTRKIAAAGGKRVRGPDKMPGVGIFSYFADPDGTLFGVIQPEEKG